MNLANISIKRPVLMLSVVILMVSTGILSLTRMGVDLYPDVTIPVVSVSTRYPGAGPEEIEEQISKPLEEKLSSVAGLKRLSSENQGGISVVIAEFELEADIQYAEQQVRDKTTQVRALFPREAEEPLIQRLDPTDSPIVRMVLFADLTPAELYDLAEDVVKPGIERVPGVSSIEIVGGTPREVHITLDRDRLNEYRIPASEIADRLGATGQDTPLGSYAKDGVETTYRFDGSFDSIDEIRETILLFGGDPAAP